MAKFPKEINPYIGPVPFDHNSKDIFFGRNEEAQRLLSMIFANQIVILYAPSGAGKTSLLNAKMTDLLEKEDFIIFKVKNLNAARENQVNPHNIFVYNTALALTDKNRLMQGFEQYDLKMLLKDECSNLSEIRFGIIFDQFEEIFTSHLDRWKDRRLFLEQIQEVCDEYPKSRIVFVIREDFLGKLNAYSDVWKKPPFNFHLKLLNKKKALEAIEGPAELTNRKYDKGVPELIVNELLKIKIESTHLNEQPNYANETTVEIEGEFIEPVQLQIVCKALWDSLKPEDQIITLNHLQKIGGVEKVLEDFYEQSLKKALKNYPEQEKLVRDWFELSLITPIYTRDSFLLSKMTDIGINQHVIDSLIDSYLLRKEDRAGAKWITISHDRFIEPIRKSNRKWIEKQLEDEQKNEKQRIKNIKKQVYTYVALGLAFLIPLFLIIFFLWLPSRIGSPYERALKYLYEGKQFYERGNYRQAEESLLSSLNKQHLAEASFYLGKTFTKLNDPERGIQQFQSTIQMDPNYADAYYDLGILLIQNKNIEEGYAKIKTYFELSNSRPASLLSKDMYSILVLQHFKSVIQGDDSVKRLNALEKAIDLTYQHISYTPNGSSPSIGFDSKSFVEYILKEVNILSDYKKLDLNKSNIFTITTKPKTMDLVVYHLYNNVVLFYLGNFFGEKLCVGIGLTAMLDIIDVSQVKCSHSYYHCNYH